MRAGPPSQLQTEPTVADEHVCQSLVHHVELVGSPHEPGKPAAGHQGRDAEGPGGFQRQAEQLGHLLAAPGWGSRRADAG